MGPLMPEASSLEVELLVRLPNLDTERYGKIRLDAGRYKREDIRFVDSVE